MGHRSPRLPSPGARAPLHSRDDLSHKVIGQKVLPFAPLVRLLSYTPGQKALVIGNGAPTPNPVNDKARLRGHMPYRTIADIRSANRAAGQRFMDPATLRFWRSRVGSRVWQQPDGSALFVTSEQPDLSRPRTYCVRVCWPDGRIASLTEYGALKSGQAAARYATRWTERAVDRALAAGAPGDRANGRPELSDATV